jgi:hypothetical protein
MQDSCLINTKRHPNHENKIKTKLITCKQQNNTTTERTTNEAQRLVQRFMMINCPLLWHFLQHFMMINCPLL